jgi:hypothetical protein
MVLFWFRLVVTGTTEPVPRSIVIPAEIRSKKLEEGEFGSVSNRIKKQTKP